MADPRPQQMKTIRILWASLLGSSFLEAGICFVLPPMPRSEMPAVFPVILGALSVGLTFVSFWLPAQNAARAFAGYRERVKEVVDATEDGGYRAENKRRRVLAIAPADLGRIIGISQTMLILSLALANAVSLFGLVLNRVGFPITTSLPFFVAGSTLMAIRFPSWAGFLGRVARIVDAEVEIER